MHLSNELILDKSEGLHMRTTTRIRICLMFSFVMLCQSLPIGAATPITISTRIRLTATASGLSSAAATSAKAPRQMERLGRGIVAVNQGEGKVFVSWRLLGAEPDSIAFNVYRTTGSGQPVKLNTTPLTQATCYQDSGVDFSQPVSYTVRAVLDDQEQRASTPFKFPANAPVRQYLSIPLQAGRGIPNDASVGDLNGDGEFEIVLKREDGSRDNARGGVTGSTTLEAYALDGTFMWKIDLGKNIPLNSIPK